MYLLLFLVSLSAFALLLLDYLPSRAPCLEGDEGLDIPVIPNATFGLLVSAVVIGAVVSAGWAILVLSENHLCY